MTLEGDKDFLRHKLVEENKAGDDTPEDMLALLGEIDAAEAVLMELPRAA